MTPGHVGRTEPVPVWNDPRPPASGSAVRPRAVDRQRSDEHLRNIQALTDTALGRLDVEDLLVELLDRVREMLNADTAAILLLDEGRQDLVARVARGIEEEVYQ